MRDDTKKWLKYTKQVLKRQYDQHLASNEVWDIMTALRGPDCNESADAVAIKAGVTAKIRFKAFGSDLPALTNVGEVETKASYAEDYCGSHYLSHCTAAMEILGMDWPKEKK